MIFKGTNRIVAAYGVFGATRGQGVHKGVDISTPPGEDATLYAAVGGSVEFAGCVPRGADRTWEWGWHVRVISHESGLRCRHTYAHCAVGSLHVRMGDRVLAGQALGLMGATGNAQGDAQGPHVHYQVDVWKNGAWLAVNPCGWAGVKNTVGSWQNADLRRAENMKMLKCFGEKNMQAFTRTNNAAEYLAADRVASGCYRVAQSELAGDAGESAAWRWVGFMLGGGKVFTPLIDDRNQLLDMSVEEAEAYVGGGEELSTALAERDEARRACALALEDAAAARTDAKAQREILQAVSRALEGGANKA